MTLARLDVTSFINEDGTLKDDDIKSFVEAVAPAPPPPAPDDNATTTAPTPPARPDLGQGARGSATALNGDPLRQALERKLGIR